MMLQGKAMQDPEIQNILSDPVMRQVSTENILVQLCSTRNIGVLCRLYGLLKKNWDVGRC